MEETELIEQLKDSQERSKDIKIKLKEGAITQKEIEEARQSYYDVANRGAILFFCIKKLSAISSMYEYSLGSYLSVFKRSMEQANKDNLLMTRIKNIIDKLTINLYDYVTLGIFKNHKRVFCL